MASLPAVELRLDQPLPQNPEAERSVLGSILLNPSSLDRVAEKLRVEDFYRDAHRQIFSAMMDLSERSRAIDLLTIKEELARKLRLDEVGGAAYISSLVDGIPDIANLDRYAEIVREKSTLRKLILMGNRVIQSALDRPEGPSEVLGEAEREIYQIAEQGLSTGFTPIDRITRTNMTSIEQIQHAGKLLTGITTGYAQFDAMTSGFQRQDLLILAARPSMGKTSLMLNIAEAMAVPDQGGNDDELHAVGIFSLEMSKEQLGLRLLSSQANVSSHLIRSGFLSEKNWQDWISASSRLARSKIFVDDTATIDLIEMRAKARRLKREHGIDMLMVDYLQLINSRGRTESRNQEISQISRGLKALAKELDIPLLSLSQLSRRPEQRAGDHRPQLADLRESGSIEQDADVVFFIYRDEVYNKETEDKGIAEIIISKQRNGPIGDFKLVFRNDITKFFNYAPEPDYIP
ncbi:MAG: replicative DNA helicase [Thermoanaerobaculia bacterium]